MRKIVTLLSITALFWACNKDNDETFVQQVTYQMEVTCREIGRASCRERV